MLGTAGALIHVPVLFLSSQSRSATPNCAKGQAGSGMVQRVSTVAFEGIEARAVDVQVQVAPGLPAFAMVTTFNPK